MSRAVVTDATAEHRGEAEAQRRPLQMGVGRSILYLSPALTLIGVVYGYSLVNLGRLSVMRVGVGLTPSEFVGYENYSFFLSDAVFRSSLLHNAMLFAAIPLITALALIIAYSFNDEVPGWKIVRALVFLPYILAITAVGLVFIRIFTLDGLLNEGLRALGLGAVAADWLGSERTALWAILAVIVWRETGFGVFLLHAAILDVPQEQLDAARVDGAGWWRRLRHVVLPHISGQIELYVVVLVITLLSWVFAYIFVMTQGGPGISTTVTELYIYLQTFRYGAIGIGAAVSMALLIAAVGLFGAFFWLRRARARAGA